MNHKLWFLGIIFCLTYLTSCQTLQQVNPNYPKKVNRIIKENIKDVVIEPSFLGIPDTVHSDQIPIWYESIGNPEHPTIFLISGFRTPSTNWSKEFIQTLTAAEYHVIRYDHRDLGLSGKVDDWKKNKNYYTLSDMSNDIVRILDKMNIEKVHLVGMSMGGMIAQTIAIEHPQKVESLISISSTGYLHDPEITTFTFSTLLKAAGLMVKYGVKDRNLKQGIKKRIEAEAYLKNDPEITEDYIQKISERYIYEENRGAYFDKKAAKKHMNAIKKSGSRLEKLKNIKNPVLVIHGNKDPLILPTHAIKYSEHFTDARLVMMDNLGHMPNEEELKEISDQILTFVAGM